MEGNSLLGTAVGEEGPRKGYRDLSPTSTETGRKNLDFSEQTREDPFGASTSHLLKVGDQPCSVQGQQMRLRSASVEGDPGTTPVSQVLHHSPECTLHQYVCYRKEQYSGQ